MDKLWESQAGDVVIRVYLETTSRLRQTSRGTTFHLSRYSTRPWILSIHQTDAPQYMHVLRKQRNLVRRKTIRQRKWFQINTKKVLILQKNLRRSRRRLQPWNVKNLHQFDTASNTSVRPLSVRKEARENKKKKKRWPLQGVAEQQDQEARNAAWAGELKRKRRKKKKKRVPREDSYPSSRATAERQKKRRQVVEHSREGDEETTQKKKKKRKRKIRRQVNQKRRARK